MFSSLHGRPYIPTPPGPKCVPILLLLAEAPEAQLLFTSDGLGTVLFKNVTFLLDFSSVLLPLARRVPCAAPELLFFAPVMVFDF